MKRVKPQQLSDAKSEEVGPVAPVAAEKDQPLKPGPDSKTPSVSQLSQFQPHFFADDDDKLIQQDFSLDNF